MLTAYTSVVSHRDQEVFLQVFHTAVTADLVFMWVLILSDKIVMRYNGILISLHHDCFLQAY